MPTEVGEQFISVETKDKCPRCGKNNHIWYEHDKNHEFVCKECSTKKCEVVPLDYEIGNCVHFTAHNLINTEGE